LSLVTTFAAGEERPGNGQPDKNVSRETFLSGRDRNLTWPIAFDVRARRHGTDEQGATHALSTVTDEAFAVSSVLGNRAVRSCLDWRPHDTRHLYFEPAVPTQMSPALRFG